MIIIQLIDIVNAEKNIETINNIYNVEKNRIKNRKPNKKTTTRLYTI